MMGETQLHDFVLLLDGESQSSYGCPVCLGNYGNLSGFPENYESSSASQS